MDATRATTADAGGGGGAPRDYKRDPKGSHTGGRFTRNPAAKTAKPAPKSKPAPKPLVPVRAHGRGSMRIGGHNDPAQVRQLQALLGVLGLGTPPTNGEYDHATEQAVRAAQERLGLKPTGRAGTSLVNRLIDSYSLSPCVQRSDGPDPYDLLRAALLAGDFDEEADMADELEEPGGTARSTLLRCCPDEHTFAREWPLDDIVIRSGGDGRTVEAYAAVFDTPAEIKDQHGHYLETIDRAAFNEVLAEGIGRIGCFYHHGMTLHGTPSDLGSVPIGSPVDVRADGKGLRTVTRFNKSALADSVLEAIRAGDLKGYSFRGGIRKSNPPRIARARDGHPLPTVVRMSLGLNEYGPTPTPYYADAKILAVRSAQAIATDPVALAELQAELAHILSRSTPALDGLDQEPETATPEEAGPGAEDQPQALRSAADIARRIRVAEILRGMK